MKSAQLKEDWNKVVENVSNKFADGEPVDVDGILFLIGVQEVGKGYKKYNKNEKVDLLHVAICSVLSRYGYYNYEGIDEQGWPHYSSVQELPNLKSVEQSILIKDAIVTYAKEHKWRYFSHNF